MKSQSQIKIEDLTKWLDDRYFFCKEKKVSVLMNDHISGLIASKIAVDTYGEENVVNVVIPCYSSEDYILNSAKFSNDLGVKYKNIGIKHLYDSLMEKDIEDGESIDVVDFLRSQIMDALSIKNKSMVFEFVKKGVTSEKWWLGEGTRQGKLGNYVFKMSYYKETGEKVYDIWDVEFTEEELKESANELGI